MASQPAAAAPGRPRSDDDDTLPQPATAVHPRGPMPASTTTTTVTHPDGSTVSVTTECEEGSGLKEGFENRLDAVCEGIISNGTCAIPGLVVMARKGQDTYHKNFGMADKEKGTPMELDAQFRCFSMTKVFAAAVALQFKEAGLLDFEAPVETYLPSFAREFEVLTEAQEDEAGAQEIPYTSFLTGETTTLRYTKAKAKSKLLVKHCLAESSGISYEMFTDFELWLKAPIFGQSYAAANALRRRAGKGYYTSNTIIGQACTLAEYCDAIAEAGFLTVEPVQTPPASPYATTRHC
jgi:CubicO group peptidase (beta-lactamase class C family)